MSKMRENVSRRARGKCGDAEARVQPATKSGRRLFLFAMEVNDFRWLVGRIYRMELAELADLLDQQAHAFLCQAFAPAAA